MTFIGAPPFYVCVERNPEARNASGFLFSQTICRTVLAVVPKSFCRAALPKTVVAHTSRFRPGVFANTVISRITITIQIGPVYSV